MYYYSRGGESGLHARSTWPEWPWRPALMTAASCRATVPLRTACSRMAAST